MRLDESSGCWGFSRVETHRHPLYSIPDSMYSSVAVCTHEHISKNWHAVHMPSEQDYFSYISNTSDKKQSESKNNYPPAVIGFKATVPCPAKSVSGLMTLSSPIMFSVLKQSFGCNISAWCSPFHLSWRRRICRRHLQPNQERKWIKATDVTHTITTVQASWGNKQLDVYILRPALTVTHTVLIAGYQASQSNPPPGNSHPISDE